MDSSVRPAATPSQAERKGRYHWMHGVANGGDGPVRQSINWRLVRSALLSWNNLELHVQQELLRAWLSNFLCNSSAVQENLIQEVFGARTKTNLRPCFTNRKATSVAVGCPSCAKTVAANMAVVG